MFTDDLQETWTIASKGKLKIERYCEKYKVNALGSNPGFPNRPLLGIIILPTSKLLVDIERVNAMSINYFHI